TRPWFAPTASLTGPSPRRLSSWSAGRIVDQSGRIWRPPMPVYDSALDLVGNTPIVDISQLSPNPNVRILAKLEGQNPGGSVKDRAAKYMVEDAEKAGQLTPGKIIIESSSGNTGIALAMLSRARGYHLKVVLPENVSVERRQL